MAKVKDIKHTTPSDEIIKNQQQEYVVTDAKGRKITLKKPSLSYQYDIVDALGEKSANNQRYMAMVSPLMFVVSIDDMPVHRITTKAQVNGLLDRLDEDGLKAVMDGIQDHFAANKTEEEIKKEIKK